jgi:hypothetical protein
MKGNDLWRGKPAGKNVRTSTSLSITLDCTEANLSESAETALKGSEINTVLGKDLLSTDD